MLTRAMIEAAGLDYIKVLALLRKNSQPVVAMAPSERRAPPAPFFRKPGPQGIPNGTIERRPWASPRESSIAKIDRLGVKSPRKRKHNRKSGPCRVVHPNITIGYVASQPKFDNHY